jgi:hypothetical protein
LNLKNLLKKLDNPVEDADLDEIIEQAKVDNEGKLDFNHFVMTETKEERITDKADIWAAACILYYLLSGKHAFNGGE